MTEQITIINANLPLINEQTLFTLQIQNGQWTSINPQQGYIKDDCSIPLSSSHCRSSAILNAERRLILPGMVDGHMHLDKAFSLATVGNVSGTLGEACDNYFNNVASFTEEELQHRIMRSALQSINYGTSIIRTHIDFHTSLGEEVALRGIKAALAVKQLLQRYITIETILLSPSFLDDQAKELARKALALGADGIGGAPYLNADPATEIKTMFDLAEQYGCILDFHSDETDELDAKTVVIVAEETIKRGLQGKVTVGHLCSLASMPKDQAMPIIELIAKAQLHAISLPGANLYLQGRGDDERIRRGVTRIKDLLAAGVNTSIGSDNINDPFHPFGRGDLLQIALLAAYGAHMGAPSDMRTLLRMITENPAALVAAKNYGISVGHEADFVVFDVTSVEQLFVMLPDRRWIYRKGQWLRSGDHPFQWNDDQLTELWQGLNI